MRYFTTYVMLLSLFAVGLFTSALAVTDVEGFLGPSAIVADADSGKLFIALSAANKIAVFDIKTEKVLTTFDLPAPPGGLALSADCSKLYVTTENPAGLICVINTTDGSIECNIPAGHFPCAPVLSPDQSRIYICNRFLNSVSSFDLDSKQKDHTIPVGREPVASAITPNGKWLLVANHLPGGPADTGFISIAVSVVDTTSSTVAADIRLGNGTTSARGICISPDGKYAYVTHILGRYWNPTTQLERGWMNTNAMSIIDIAGMKLLNTVLLDDIDSGAANPWGLACTPDGKYICIAHAGTHEISVIDRPGLHEKLRTSAAKTTSDYTLSYVGVPNDLSFLVELRKKIRLSGNGPRQLVVIDNKLYITEYFTDSLAVVNIEPKVFGTGKSIPLGSAKPLTVARKGNMLFNDASLCFQNWQSCATCHPDARADGLNWDLLNDGIGNPKQTKSMLLAHKTPPAMVSGIRDNAEAAVRSGIRFIQYVQRPESDATAIDEYLKSLKSVPSPRLIEGNLTQAAERGKLIFNRAGCAECHPAPLYTDMEEHDVGTGLGRDKGKRFDTPTLVELWRTAPYLYDGRAESIKDVLKKFNENDTHGKTSALTEQQIDDLAEFLMYL
jgi:DNA-binding beta-propeller fold protein YncE